MCSSSLVLPPELSTSKSHGSSLTLHVFSTHFMLVNLELNECWGEKVLTLPSIEFSGIFMALKEDYTHLLRILSTNYFKSLKSKQRKKQWKFTDDTEKDIQAIVSQVMNNCTTYSKDIDLSFGPIQWHTCFILSCIVILYSQIFCICRVILMWNL